MPISLGDPTTNPQWSKFWLLIFWISQFLITIFLQFWTVILVFALGATGGHQQMPWKFTTTLIIMLISQFLIFCTILYQCSYASRLAHLTFSRCFKMELAKSLYFLFFVLVIAISGSGFPMDGNISGGAYVWAMIWRLAIFVGPFWSALVYVVAMRRKVAPEFVFEYRDWSEYRAQL